MSKVNVNASATMEKWDPKKALVSMADGKTATIRELMSRATALSVEFAWRCTVKIVQLLATIESPSKSGQLIDQGELADLLGIGDPKKPKSGQPKVSSMSSAYAKVVSINGQSAIIADLTGPEPIDPKNPARPFGDKEVVAIVLAGFWKKSLADANRLINAASAGRKPKTNKRDVSHYVKSLVTFAINKAKRDNGGFLPDDSTFAQECVKLVATSFNAAIASERGNPTPVRDKSKHKAPKPVRFEQEAINTEAVAMLASIVGHVPSAPRTKRTK